jgi:hypothetical protein
MNLNSVATNNIITVTNNLERRINALEAKLQGAIIDRVRIGTAIITSAKIADLSITTAKIDTGAITNAKVNDLSAVKVTAGTLSASRIDAGTITATKLNVSTLSAISADFGTLTAGSITGLTITGSLIRTSSGSNRVEMTSTHVEFFSSGSRRQYFRNDIAATYGVGMGFLDLGGSTIRAVWGASGSDLVYGSTNCPLLLFQTLGDGSHPGNIVIEPNDGDVYFLGTFQIRGSTKTAIVPTSQGYNALYCVESPEVWFFDIAPSMAKIDPMFWEVTEGESKTVTGKSGEVMIFRRRRGFGTIRLETKSRAEFERNVNFWGKQYDH